jgi:hypothetical protein
LAQDLDKTRLPADVFDVPEPKPPAPLSEDEQKKGAGQPIIGYETRTAPPLREDSNTRPEPKAVKGSFVSDVTAFRRGIGYLLGLIALVVAAVFFFWSIEHLQEMTGPAVQQHERFALAKLVAHSVITVAFVYFIYQVLRLAERLVIPHWWDTEYTKVMLGIRDPVGGTLRFARKLAQKAVEKGSGK